MPAKTLKDIKAIIFFRSMHSSFVLLCPSLLCIFLHKKSLKVTQMCYYYNCAGKRCENYLDVTHLLQ